MESLYISYLIAPINRELCWSLIILFARVFLFFLVEGTEKRNRSKAGNRHLYYRNYRNVPSPNFSRTSDKEPPVHFGKEKRKNDELAMSLLKVDKSLFTRAHGFSCRSFNGLILEVGALVVDVAANAKKVENLPQSWWGG